MCTIALVVKKKNTQLKQNKHVRNLPNVTNKEGGAKTNKTNQPKEKSLGTRHAHDDITLNQTL